MKIAKPQRHYSKKYFLERDHIDLHLAYALKRFFQENRLQKILDVGCGSGRLVKFLLDEGFDAYGSDYAPSAIRLAQKLVGKKRIYSSDATSLRFSKNKFDAITMISVIEHLTPKQVNVFLNKAHQILKPNGKIFFVTPNFATPLRFIQKEKWFGYSDPTHINFYTPSSVSKTLQQHGFKQIKFLFKTQYDVDFWWDLPASFKYLPLPIRAAITYLLISTPLAFMRNSFWVSASK